MALRPYKMRFSDLNRLRRILMIVVESGGGMLIDLGDCGFGRLR